MKSLKQLLISFLLMEAAHQVFGSCERRPLVANGFLNQSSIVSGIAIWRIHCNPNFMLNGSTLMTCSSVGWTSGGNCVPSFTTTCPPNSNDLIPNGDFVDEESLNEARMRQRSFACRQGYVLNGTGSVVCMKNSSENTFAWVAQGVCRQVPGCQEPAVSDGIVLPGNSNFGSNRTYTCLHGTTGRIQVLFCVRNGTWLQIGRCTKRPSTASFSSSLATFSRASSTAQRTTARSLSRVVSGRAGKLGSPSICNCDNSTSSSDLLTAVRLGNTTKVNHLLSLGASAQSKQASDQTSILMLAAGGGHNEMVYQILNCQCGDIDARNAMGSTALMFAASQPNENIIRKLLDKDADVEIQNNLRFTALHFATQNGIVENVKMLIDAGADLGKNDSSGDTVLIMAVRGNFTGIVEFLLRQNKSDIKINHQNNQGHTALMHAAKGGFLEIAKMLVGNSACDIKVKDLTGMTAEQIAMEYGQQEIVDLLSSFATQTTQRIRRIGDSRSSTRRLRN